MKSFEEGNGILAININRIRGKDQVISSRGLNPLHRLAFKISEDGEKIRFLELVNRKWIDFVDLPVINNKKSNTIYFVGEWTGDKDFGKIFRFSDEFETYCWVNDNGHK